MYYRSTVNRLRNGNGPRATDHAGTVARPNWRRLSDWRNCRRQRRRRLSDWRNCRWHCRRRLSDWVRRRRRNDRRHCRRRLSDWVRRRHRCNDRRHSRCRFRSCRCLGLSLGLSLGFASCRSPPVTKGLIRYIQIMIRAQTNYEF